MEQLLNIIVGFFTPLLVSLLKNDQWSRKAKMGLTAVVSLVISLVVVISTHGGHITLEELFNSLGTIFTLATLAFTFIWDRTGIDETLTNTKVL